MKIALPSRATAALAAALVLPFGPGHAADGLGYSVIAGAGEGGAGPVAVKTEIGPLDPGKCPGELGWIQSTIFEGPAAIVDTVGLGAAGDVVIRRGAAGTESSIGFNRPPTGGVPAVVTDGSGVPGKILGAVTFCATPEGWRVIELQATISAELPGLEDGVDIRVQQPWRAAAPGGSQLAGASDGAVVLAATGMTSTGPDGRTMTIDGVLGLPATPESEVFSIQLSIKEASQ